MKILYGIQGTGNGHITRAKTLIPHLQDQGIKVDFVISGRKQTTLFDADIFKQRTQFFEGANLITRNGELAAFKTLTKNRFLPFLKDVCNLDIGQYDLIISDFEPITAWAAKLKQKPSIGLSNQASFYYPVPQIKGYTGSKLLTRFVAPCQFQIGLHWHHFGFNILPPMIEKITASKPKHNDYIVYMPFENQVSVIEWLKPFKHYHFTFYCNTPVKRNLGHIQLQPLNHQIFHQHLQLTSGVICNAGFGLLSETLHLGKKLFVKPLLGQYEQLSNALVLQVFQRGTISSSLDKNLLKQWLNLDSPEPIHFNPVAEPLAKWIHKGDFDNIKSLLDQVWSDHKLNVFNKSSSKLIPNKVFA